MSDIKQLVLKTIQTQQLLNDDHRVLVAVSGGPDSLCLLLVLTQLFPAMSVTAAYIDHNLRPAESPGEIAFVENHCRRLGIESVIRSVDVPGERAKTGESVEACSRRLRYQALEQIRRDREAHLIAVGHTADDQVEEVLLRLIRGSGLKGLSGMNCKNGVIIRPLLEISKAQILIYLKRCDQIYCRDSSNLSGRFLRNRIRHELLPLLESKFNPSIRQTIINTASRLAVEEDFLQREAAGQYSKSVTSKNGAEEQTRPLKRINSRALSAAHPALRRRVIERICWEMGSRPNHQQILSIDKMLCEGTTGTELHLPNRLRIVLEPEALLFALLDSRRSTRECFRKVDPIHLHIQAPGKYQLPEHDMNVSLEVVEGCAAPQPGTAVLDADLVIFPLTLRSPQPGDRFMPLGAPGRKSVARLLGDRKIPAHRRGHCPVLVSGQDIVCVVGVEIDEHYRISERTKKSLLVRVADAQV